MNDEQRPDEGLATAQAWLVGLLAGLVVLALMGVAYTIGVNRGDDEAPAGGEQGTASAPAEQQPAGGETAAAGPGEDLFVSKCGSCHALEAAGTTGTTGPDLDALGPAPEQVLSAIENGGAGSGVMPAGLVEGEQAQQVADYVGQAAGG